jgi:hypothetical protein
MQKQAVIKLLDQMPGEIDADELMYQLYVPRKREIAERYVREGRVISHEDVSREIDEWLRWSRQLKRVPASGRYASRSVATPCEMRSLSWRLSVTP